MAALSQRQHEIQPRHKTLPMVRGYTCSAALWQCRMSNAVDRPVIDAAGMRASRVARLVFPLSTHL